MSQQSLIKLRIFLEIILLIIISGFFYLKIQPFGQVTYWGQERYFGGKGFIGKLSPIDRVTIDNKISGDPVYFSLFTPRHFDQAKIQIKYESNSNQPLFELGLLRDRYGHYELKPLENKIIDSLSSWQKIANGDITLYQREKKYNNFSEFFRTPPAQKEIATYNIGNFLSDNNLYKNYQLVNYQQSSEKKEINFPLRGSHQFYLYLKDEPLDLNFVFSYLEKKDKPEQVKIDLYRNSDLISSQQLTLAPGDNKLNFLEKNLPTGVYRVGINSNDNLIIKEIFYYGYLAFINKLALVNAATNVSIFTDVTRIKVKTINPAAFDTLDFGDDKLILNETYKQFTSAGQNGIKEIKIPHADLILEGSGVFAFNPTELFNPGIKNINGDFQLDNSINYILATYTPPIDNGQEKIATAEFELGNAYQEKNKYSFIFSVPGQEPEDYLKIKEIKISLEGKSLWEKIKTKLK